MFGLGQIGTAFLKLYAKAQASSSSLLFPCSILYYLGPPRYRSEIYWEPKLKNRDPKNQKFFVTQQLPGIQNKNQDPKIQKSFLGQTRPPPPPDGREIFLDAT